MLEARCESTKTMLDAEAEILRIMAEAERLKSNIWTHARGLKFTSQPLPGNNVADRLLDQPLFTGEPSTYIIASERRSGSHLLASLLRNSRQAGIPLEYFHRRHWDEWRLARGSGASNNQTLYKLLITTRTTPNGIFSFKAHWDQFTFFSSLGLEHFARRAKFIRISRRDKLAQAISLAIARQTGSWSYEQGVKKKPIYSRKAIQSALLHIARQSFLWSQYLDCNCIQFHQVYYEDICNDRYVTMKKLCEYLEIEWNRETSETTAIQRTSINAEWKNAYQNDVGESPVSPLNIRF